MTVNISGGGHMCMTEAMAYAHAVKPIKEQHAHLCMLECMWADVGQAVAFAEVCQPVTDISGVHGHSVFSWEKIIIIL